MWQLEENPLRDGHVHQQWPGRLWHLKEAQLVSRDPNCAKNDPPTTQPSVWPVILQIWQAFVNTCKNCGLSFLFWDDRIGTQSSAEHQLQRLTCCVSRDGVANTCVEMKSYISCWNLYHLQQVCLFCRHNEGIFTHIAPSPRYFLIFFGNFCKPERWLCVTTPLD